jgi:diguanylate cyclase (GGDEF)-like protein
MRLALLSTLGSTRAGRRLVGGVLGAVCVAFLTGVWLLADVLVERTDALEEQRLMLLAQERAGLLAISAGRVPPEFAAGLDGADGVVIGRNGATVFASAAIPVELIAPFVQASTVNDSPPGRARSLSWYADGREWRGAVAEVPPSARVSPALRDAKVVIFATARPFAARLGAIGGRIALGFLLALAAAVAVLAWLGWRYLPGIAAVRAGLRNLLEQRFDAPVAHGADEMCELTLDIEAAQRHFAAAQRAQDARRQIDDALLATVDLDQGIERALPVLCMATHAHAAGVILVDTAATTHGRLLIVLATGESPDVQRVTLDADMAAALRATGEAVTIARTEYPRHAFLTAFCERGANFFWLWPVVKRDELRGVLVVAFESEPRRDAEAPRLGAAFAQRLRMSIAQSARDEELYRQAHFDPLTQLPNRVLFRDRLSQELTAAAAGLARGALLYVDLDHFKKINDSLGHAAGDQLLGIVAQRLKSCIKDGDTVARLGGDEFSIVLRHVADRESARAVAERIVYSLQLPVNLAGRDHHVRASVGIAMFPADGATLDDLVRNADLAMYRAKETGRGRAMFYEESMSARLMRISDSGLHRALKRRELSLFYQPQFRIADGQLAGVEALLRWHTRYEGTKLPAEFIPSAEQTGLIVDIGDWVVDTACAQLAAWRGAGFAVVPVAVNVSAQQLMDGRFVERVARLLEQHALPARLLEIELVESVLADDRAERALRDLAELGVGLAIDDFGTGFSSLNYLRRYPVATVKLDRSFLEEVPQNGSAAVVAESVITMAHSLGKRVVAEGVETIEQLEFLRGLHCALAQGFFLARPMSSEALTELCASRRMDGDAAELERAAG